ncbi:MAG: right-handed parallel beta-helix repeat-containing protein [Fimbriimonadaceae bacterium]|jgi:hypothetical protein|nr:right-handed parallel beta-helix repeat-containing protein [Fimbriimonadaceae bacterium]
MVNVALVCVSALASQPREIQIVVPPGKMSQSLRARVDEQISNRDGEGKVRILFRRGEHVLDNGLQINRSDVELVGEEGATLNVGVSLKNWRPVTRPEILNRLPESVRTRVRVATVPGDGELPGFSKRGFGNTTSLAHAELSLNDVPSQPARYPNVTGTGSFEKEGWLLTAEAANGKITVPNDRPSKWENLSDVWTYGYWQFDWADSYEPVASYDPQSRVLAFSGEPSQPIQEFGIAKSRRFFFLHVLEELDQVGEYWMDRSRREVYAILPTGNVRAEISLSSDPVVLVQGANNVTIRNLRFVGTRGVGVSFLEATDSSLRDSVVLNSGMMGVSIKGGKNVQIVGCQVKGAGQSGVDVSGGDRRTLTPSNHLIENCVIEKVSRWNRTYNPAVLVNGVGQIVRGCTLQDLPHTAILFGGNDHLFEKNLVQRVCKETSDAGAFYIGRNFTTRGTMIRWNHFRDFELRVTTEGNWHMVVAVYLDDCQAGISIEGNIFEAKARSVLIGGGRDNRVIGNIFLDSDPAIEFDARARGWAERHFRQEWDYHRDIRELPVLESPWKERYPALAAALLAKEDLTYPAGNEISHNVSAGGKWLALHNGLTEKDAKMEGNVVLPTRISLAEALAKRPKTLAPIPVGQIGAKR